MKTVTQWFDAKTQKPVREGSYEFRYHMTGFKFKCLFKNGNFYVFDGSEFHGILLKPGLGAWRGLAEKPE